MHQLHHAFGASRHQRSWEAKEDVVRMCEKWYDYMQPGWCQPIRQEFMENECEALPGVAYPRSPGQPQHRKYQNRIWWWWWFGALQVLRQCILQTDNLVTYLLINHLLVNIPNMTCLEHTKILPDFSVARCKKWCCCCRSCRPRNLLSTRSAS